MSIDTVLYIPDTHVQPGENFDRFDALWKWLKRNNRSVDWIVHAGDHWDFDALCSHDSKLPEWNERSVQESIDAGIEGLVKIVDIADAANAEYIVMTLGNHEERWRRWVKEDNRVRTFIPEDYIEQVVDDNFNGVELVPFQQPTIINGVAFAHYFVSGLMNRPASGDRPALSLLRTQHMSVVQGHKHTFDHAEHTRPDGSKIHALIGGCFVDPNAPFSFAGASRKLWWNGVHILHFTAPGEFDVEQISLARMGA